MIQTWSWARHRGPGPHILQRVIELFRPKSGQMQLRQLVVAAVNRDSASIETHLQEAPVEVDIDDTPADHSIDVFVPTLTGYADCATDALGSVDGLFLPSPLTLSLCGLRLNEGAA